MSITSIVSPAEKLEQWLIQTGALENECALDPLPTTRALGERFQTSHGTAARILSRLTAEGRLWQHANGRYYPAIAGKVFERPKPIAVLLRRMYTWSALCREVMEGFDRECAEQERPLLLLQHNQLLVEEGPGRVLHVAPEQTQRQMIQEAVLRYGQDVSGYLFDELWSHQQIHEVIGGKYPTATFYRRSKLEDIRSFSVDFEAAAELALRHLLDCGYQRIVLVKPSPLALVAIESVNTAEKVFKKKFRHSGVPVQILAINKPQQENPFLREISNSHSPRTGILCPEDNFALYLAERMKHANIPLGKRHGIISTMGTKQIANTPVSAIRHPFSEIGRACAHYLLTGETTPTQCHPRLVISTSTS